MDLPRGASVDTRREEKELRDECSRIVSLSGEPRWGVFSLRRGRGRRAWGRGTGSKRTSRVWGWTAELVDESRRDEAEVTLTDILSGVQTKQGTTEGSRTGDSSSRPLCTTYLLTYLPTYICKFNRASKTLGYPLKTVKIVYSGFCTKMTSQRKEFFEGRPRTTTHRLRSPRRVGSLPPSVVSVRVTVPRSYRGVSLLRRARYRGPRVSLRVVFKATSP